ncbi:MAG: hypothetical protein GC164_16600 [Phycisphaera sp.]|nr:hypothetical protein [Phycisphaera sp.]
MPFKAVWIMIGITMALWLGGALGCASQDHPDQNYKTLEEDRPQFQPPDSGGAAPVESTTATAQTDAEGPSLVGVDRSHWDKTTVGPDDGVTHHHPVYFKDCPIQHDEIDRLPIVQLDAPGSDPEAAYRDALSGERAGWLLDGKNILGAFTQPVKFGFDLGTWPVHAVIQHPYSDVTTPSSCGKACDDCGGCGGCGGCGDCETDGACDEDH